MTWQFPSLFGDWALDQLFHCPSPRSTGQATAAAQRQLAEAHTEAAQLTSYGIVLASQRDAVRAQLAESQRLAAKLREQAQSQSLTLEEVVGHFFQVYNVASVIATDRDRWVLTCAGHEYEAHKRMLHA